MFRKESLPFPYFLKLCAHLLAISCFGNRSPVSMIDMFWFSVSSFCFFGFVFTYPPLYLLVSSLCIYLSSFNKLLVLFYLPDLSTLGGKFFVYALQGPSSQLFGSKWDTPWLLHSFLTRKMLSQGKLFLFGLLWVVSAEPIICPDNSQSGQWGGRKVQQFAPTDIFLMQYRNLKNR